MPTDRTEEPRDVILTANMTLRDYFAAQVVAQVYEAELAHGERHGVIVTDDEIAQEAYELADALLRVREKERDR